MIRLATMVLNPGQRQLFPRSPNLSSLMQITSSPCTLFQSGTLNRCSYRKYSDLMLKEPIIDELIN